MGGSVSKEEVSNFGTLLDALRLKNIQNIKYIIENSATNYNFYFNRLTFYHYLIVEALFYDRDELVQLCDLI